MTTAPIAPNVERGAAFLDHNVGRDWPDRIDLDALDLSSRCDCVVGQLFADDPDVGKAWDKYPYDVGIEAMGVDDPGNFGFTTRQRQSFDRLTSSWRTLIRRRRGA